jgi:hypothetical protein
MLKIKGELQAHFASITAEGWNSGALCACMCIPLVVARQLISKRTVIHAIFHVVHVISKESR